MGELPPHHIEPLLSPEQIRERVGTLADEIVGDYGDQAVTLLGILSGAGTLMADLGRALYERGLTNVQVEYMAVESYGSDTKSSGEPKITKDTKGPIKEKNVIVVEDIVDTGYSLASLLEILMARTPASLTVLALLSKPERREVEVPIDYLGFEIPDKFVVGYGIDWAEQYRIMPWIGAVVFD